MLRFLKSFIKGERGQAMTEYGFVMGLVVLVVIVMITAYGEQLAAKYEKLKDEIVSAGTTN